MKLRVVRVWLAEDGSVNYQGPEKEWAFGYVAVADRRNGDTWRAKWAGSAPNGKDDVGLHSVTRLLGILYGIPYEYDDGVAK